MNIKILILIISLFLLTNVFAKRSGGRSGSRSFSSRSSSSSSSSTRRSSGSSSTYSYEGSGEMGSFSENMKGVGVVTILILLLLFFLFVPSKILSKIRNVNGLEIRLAINIPYEKFIENINEHFREKYISLYHGKVPDHSKYDEKRLSLKFYEYFNLNKDKLKYAFVQDLATIKLGEIDSHYNKITKNILNEVSQIEKSIEANQEGYFIIDIVIAYKKEKLNLDIDESSKKDLLYLMKNFSYGEEKYKDISYRFTNVAFKENNLTEENIKEFYPDLKELV